FSHFICPQEGSVSMSYRLIAPVSVPVRASCNSLGQLPLRKLQRSAVLSLCLAAALAAQAQEQPAPEPVVSSTSSDQTQPKLTLNQLVQAVLAHNPELRSVQQSGVTAQAAVISAGALPNPKLEWSRGDNKARLASATPGNVTSMGVSVPIEMPSV